MKIWLWLLPVAGWCGLLLTGCEARDNEQVDVEEVVQQDLGASPQENLGRGIVVGTLGARRESQDLPASVAGAQRVAGQVLKLEGGAYVIRESGGWEVRIPLDENTEIDRPAHVGDHIEAYLDGELRAMLIRNIDDQETDNTES